MNKTSLIVLATAVLITVSAMGMGESGIRSDPPARGSSATHDAGNFSINIGDDGGNTAWDTLVLPTAMDHLNEAYFGMGIDSNTVDFGKRGDFDTIESLSFNDSWSHTNETSHCVFSGEAGQDFDFINVTQRTFMNDYEANTPGHTGRWLVVDYIVSSNRQISSDLLTIQMMDVDLLSDQDEFDWDPDYNMVATNYGTTYIGLAYFNDNSIPLHGHNAGLMSSSVFDGEDVIFDHMESPNNQTSSATKQNWYMDLVARIPEETFPGEAHVSFAIVVGKNMDDLRNAVEDARSGMMGSWSSDPPANWQKGEVDLEASYTGIFWPPRSIEATYLPPEGGDPVPVDHVITGNRTISLSINTTEAIPTQGRLRYSLKSVDPMGTETSDVYWEFRADNQGPTINLETDIDTESGWARGSFNVSASGNDNGGSGVDMIFMGEGEGSFSKTSTLYIETEGDDLMVSAFAVDSVGNIGPVKEIKELKNDGTLPEILSFETIPDQITEDSPSTVEISARVSDSLSGVDPARSEIRWGLNSVTSAPLELDREGEYLNTSITNSWEAAQDNDLVISLDLYDKAGNLLHSEISDRVDPLNDLPDFTIVKRSDPWQREEFLIEFVGEDPDGDTVHFYMSYRLGDQGDWIEMEGSMIRSVDRFTYWIRTPDTNYEGPMWVKAEADDGSEKSSVDPVEVLIDRKPPVIESNHTMDAWSGKSVTVSFEASDGGSGLDSYWMDVGNYPSVKVEDFTTTVDEEGVTPITAHATDRSGNSFSMQMDPVRIDRTPPSVWDVVMTPESPDEDDDLSVEITAKDNLSGIHIGPVIRIVTGDEVIEPDTISDTDGALFITPFEGMAGESFKIRITASDLAGNEMEWESPMVQILDDIPGDTPDITYPESVETGESWEVTINLEGEVRLSVRYPGTTWDWIISPDREEGDMKTYSLPAPYGGNEITLRIFYQDPNGTEIEWPPSGRLSIPITGGTDSDGDGLEDSWEILRGFDPSQTDDTSSDSDEDGLNVIQEMFNLTDPDDEDTDGDDMEDGWEASNGTLPFRDDPNEDPDGDGWSNIAEYVNDADPRDPENHPDDLPVTPWYWMLIIFLVLFAIMGYFVRQMFNKRKLEEDNDFGIREEDSEDWDEKG